MGGNQWWQTSHSFIYVYNVSASSADAGGGRELRPAEEATGDLRSAPRRQRCMAGPLLLGHAPRRRHGRHLRSARLDRSHCQGLQQGQPEGGGADDANCRVGGVLRRPECKLKPADEEPGRAANRGSCC